MNSDWYVTEGETVFGVVHRMAAGGFAALDAVHMNHPDVSRAPRFGTFAEAASYLKGCRYVIDYRHDAGQGAPWHPSGRRVLDAMPLPDAEREIEHLQAQAYVSNLHLSLA